MHFELLELILHPVFQDSVRNLLASGSQPIRYVRPSILNPREEIQPGLSSFTTEQV